MPVYAAIEQWKIPTYPIPEAEEMPMFAETANHQCTTGNPYPVRVVSAADGEHRAEKEGTVIRLENEYIRLAILPAMGGRIFEAFDKTTGYDFLYRQHVIKPALIGAYGAWISGGIEFNWPFHHRPSAVMTSMGYDSSKTVIETYYEVLLKTRYVRDSESGYMIDLIYNSISLDFDNIYNEAMGYDLTKKETMPVYIFRMFAYNKENNVSSWWIKNSEPLTTTFNNLVDKFYVTAE